MGWWNRMVARAWRDEPQGSDDIEAAVMPRTGRVVVMSSTGNEVISPEKAAAIFDAVTLRRRQPIVTFPDDLGGRIAAEIARQAVNLPEAGLT